MTNLLHNFKAQLEREFVDHACAKFPKATKPKAEQFSAHYSNA
jgi:hypothetical protein